jgi:hypothetical protein
MVVQDVPAKVLSCTSAGKSNCLDRGLGCCRTNGMSYFLPHGFQYY